MASETSNGPWTEFMDMYSGGSQKLKWKYIYIEAPEQEAEIIFQNRFGRNPHRVTCTCCGSDYSITESPTLEEATAYARGCAYAYVGPDGTEYPDSQAWVPGKGIVIPGVKGQYVERSSNNLLAKPYVPLLQYIESDMAHCIRSADIKPQERAGELKEEGYVWR